MNLKTSKNVKSCRSAKNYTRKNNHFYSTWLMEYEFCCVKSSLQYRPDNIAQHVSFFVYFFFFWFAQHVTYRHQSFHLATKFYKNTKKATFPILYPGRQIMGWLIHFWRPKHKQVVKKVPPKIPTKQVATCKSPHKISNLCKWLHVSFVKKWPRYQITGHLNKCV